MTMKDMILNDVILKNTKGRLNSFISARTQQSQIAYLEKRLSLLNSYKTQASNSMKEGKKKNLILDEYTREIKSINYQLKQLSIQS